MNKACLLSLCLAFLSMGYLPSVNREPISPLPDPFVTLKLPSRIITEFDYFDDDAFRIAAILEARGISQSEEELLVLGQIIVEQAAAIEVPPSLVLAVIEVESGFDPCAISRVGALGLMQVMPGRILGPARSRQEYGFAHHLFFDPEWNIRFGIDYLGEMIQTFGSVELALSAYNQGPTRLTEKIKARTFRGSSYADKVLSREKRYDLADRSAQSGLRAR